MEEAVGAKRLTIIFALAAQPALGQATSEGHKFLEAVRDREGTVVTQALDAPGNTLATARDMSTGQNALHIVTQRRDLSWIKFMAQRGVDPNTADENGVTPLLVAVQLGFAEGAEALLDAGARVDPTNATGETPLILAVHRRDLPLIRLLVSRGANPDRSDNSGRTARDYAELSRDASILDELERSEAERGAAGKVYGPGL